MQASRMAAQLLALALLCGGAVLGQAGSATITGTITNPSGAAVARASVSARNLASGQTAAAQSDAAGVYKLANLPAGSYEISVSAEGLASKTAQATLAAGATETVNVALGVPGGPAAPSLSDLGITPEQSQGSAQEQARLDRRSHMLKMHQRLGLITAGALVATLVASGGAGGRHSTSSGRDLHAALGSVTAGLYLTTASFAIFAPKIPGNQARGPIRLHRALAWIHGPGMILTPILGALAYEQRNRGEKVHGIAKAHGPVAVVTSAAFGLAILSVSIKF